VQPQKPLGRSSSIPAAQSGVQTDGELVVGLAWKIPGFKGKLKQDPNIYPYLGTVLLNQWILQDQSIVLPSAKPSRRPSSSHSIFGQ
jgi:hypothetical protein